MKTLSITFWLTIHLTIAIGLVYSVASHKDVRKGIEQSLRIGVTR
jgi:hypothetical protein